ncbi:MAG TPA: saccharopine dehydrogenase NADP-binding domain-containing protein [Jatrophihabitans sp.]|jgi:saccharopine dehydrogenase (NAD+, L-glutamate forming)|uniref:saccharopine dehydrogenase family protein n=1 Tax=Jatrophihabitans sp. TaxID=1932789 RepID=UPI002E087E98|nr:saccharopine dehydrogenase NADP-binding domain-containing protein [Jatrophihabitans sp.]
MVPRAPRPARSTPRSKRDFDIVVFGATGFAGKLTAEYLARNAPAGCRWALAGRNPAKLAAVRSDLATVDPALADLPLLTADVTDPASLQEVARRARVVITTVGPYALYGDALVAACAAAGTDYLDLTGEPEFVNTSFVRHHRTALDSGARLIHAAGFDSIPHDLGVYFTVKQLPEGVPLTVSGYVRAAAAFSGGTFHSAITAMSRPRQNLSAARDRKAAETRPPNRRATAVTGRPHRDPIDGGWALPLPTLDPQIVTRSARALERYGPDFRYSHFASLPHLYTAAGAALGIGAVAGLAQIPPAKRALLRRISPGDGPSAEKRAQSWFTVTFVGEGGGERVVTRVSGGDPGYDETAKMLAESALSLAFDDLPATAGQVTTAAAMGDALLDRLRKAGMGFEVLAG